MPHGPGLPRSFVKLEKHSLTAILNMAYETCKMQSPSELISFLLGRTVGSEYHCTLIVSLEPRSVGEFGLSSLEDLLGTGVVNDVMTKQQLEVCGYISCTYNANTSISDSQGQILDRILERNPASKPLALHISFAENVLGDQVAWQWISPPSSGSSSSTSKTVCWEQVDVGICSKRVSKSCQPEHEVRYRFVRLADMGSASSTLTGTVEHCMRDSILKCMSKSDGSTNTKETKPVMRSYKRGPLPPDGLCFFHLAQASQDMAAFLKTPRKAEGYAELRPVQQIEEFLAKACRDDCCRRGEKCYANNPVVLERIKIVKAAT